MKLASFWVWALICLCVISCGRAQTWEAGPVILQPGEGDAFDNIAVKDPTIVRYDEYWHIFYTAAGDGGFSIGYVAAPEFEELDEAPRYDLDYLTGGDYAAAPQIFYFRPQEKWYLIYQTRESNYQPVFSTTEDISDPLSWSLPEALVEKKEKDKWIDFWVICDEENAYLFYTRTQKHVMMMKTALADFPAGFSAPEEVYSPIHEATATYKVADKAEYHMLYEEQEDPLTNKRKFGLVTAPTLAGPWTLATPTFATGDQLDWPDGLAPWTDQVSHGEMIRSGYDERLEYDPSGSRFLIQGFQTSASDAGYDDLPWRLGVISRQD